MTRMLPATLLAATMLVGLGTAGATSQDRGLRGDANGDDRLDKTEFVVSSADRLARLDANKDGNVDKAEIDAAAEAAVQRTRARFSRLFDRTDSNADGTITRAEIEAAAEQRFARLDRDGDGLLKPEELRRRSRTAAPQSSIGTPN